MPRFYCDLALDIGNVVTLPAPLVRHIQVLRLKPGATLTLFNGQGGEFAATLLTVEKKSAIAEIKAFSPREAELAHALTLAQALPEGSKMDWIIEKAVELGATGVQPLAARRSVVKLAGERADKRRQHWQAIAVAAAEQCGRNRLPHVAEIEDFDSWIARRDLHLRILLSPRAEQSLSDWARHHPPQAITLIIGPEGGFSDEEERAATTHGVLPLSIGPRILRTETAGLAAIAACNAIWGEV